MNTILEMLRDHTDSGSISRAIPALVIVWILVLTSYASVMARTLVDIPPGWREIFLSSVLAYGISKAKEAFAGRAAAPEVTDGNP